MIVPRIKQSCPTFAAVAMIVHLSQLDIFSDLDASDIQEGKTRKARLGASFSLPQKVSWDPLTELSLIRTHISSSAVRAVE